MDKVKTIIIHNSAIVNADGTTTALTTDYHELIPEDMSVTYLNIKETYADNFCVSRVPFIYINGELCGIEQESSIEIKGSERVSIESLKVNKDIGGCSILMIQRVDY